MLIAEVRLEKELIKFETSCLKTCILELRPVRKIDFWNFWNIFGTFPTLGTLDIGWDIGTA